MTGDPSSETSDVGLRAHRLLQGAGAAGARAAAHARSRLADFVSDASARLDDQLRALLHHQIAGLIATIEATLREETGRLLLARGERDAAAQLAAEAHNAYARLAAAGRLAEPALVAELIARLRHDLIAERLPLRVGTEDEASLLVRLVDVADGAVSAAAGALLRADSRRREALAMTDVDRSELPAELHQQLVWRVAAAIRGVGGAAIDRALTEAAARVLATYDEGDRAEALSMRLAIAIDARPNELPALLEEAIGDRRLSLVVAVLACASSLSFAQVRALMVEPEDERWWLLLRAIDLDPLTIARLALALAEADPYRAYDDLPALLDAANAVAVGDARAAMATLRLPDDFRMAVEELA